MIAPQIVAEIRWLVDEGRHSQRKIARLMGVSRGSVAAIALGRRPDYEASRTKDDDLAAPVGPPKRCPGCGGMVYLPCQLCLAQSKRAQQRRLCGTDPANGKLRSGASIVEEFPQISLRPEHHARYLQVREEKERQERLSGQWPVVSGQTQNT